MRTRANAECRMSNTSAVKCAMAPPNRDQKAELLPAVSPIP